MQGGCGLILSLPFQSSPLHLPHACITPFQDSETVGAVAIDCNGRLAAATSTGGRTGKWDGRIGDTPINGAGAIEFKDKLKEAVWT